MARLRRSLAGLAVALVFTLAAGLAWVIPNEPLDPETRCFAAASGPGYCRTQTLWEVSP